MDNPATEEGLDRDLEGWWVAHSKPRASCRELSRGVFHMPV